MHDDVMCEKHRLCRRLLCYVRVEAIGMRTVESAMLFTGNYGNSRRYLRILLRRRVRLFHDYHMHLPYVWFG